MYNRYIRNDHGTYTRISQEESIPAEPRAETAKANDAGEPQAEFWSSFSAQQEEPSQADGLNGFLRRILDQLHLDHIDTGDLLLLMLLFFLFREHVDEELLIALALLLIL